MGHRRVIEIYYKDCNNLVTLLNQLVNAYRLLIGGASDLNNIALSKKSEVKDALKRAEKVGDIIDDVIDAIDESSSYYNDYCKNKSCILKTKLEGDYILTEIEEELLFKE
ncbi:hypothetical protein SH2C18_23030 [Clostridium sediminicola]|uniref:hypothetical protein n=1 Tax=Clostridium sediminicola TaxID=3114879 RepID=UPI0031F2598D